MRAWILALAACSGSDHTTPTPLEFVAYSPPQATSRDVFLAASGSTVVMSQRISRDGGATWQPLDAQLGQPDRVAITGNTVMTYANGLVRWDGTSITPVSISATDRTWRADPSGKAIAFDAVHNSISFENGATTQLPGDGDAFIQDVESNGTIAMSVSAFGVHRYDGAWTLVATPTDAGRDLLVLPDHRFALFGGATTYLFDATGMPAGTRPGVIADIGDASACDDGAIVVHDQRSTDLGATWQPLIASGDLAMHVERIGCGGGRYWMLARSDAWGYRLLSFAPGGAQTAAGNWEGPTAWAAGGPQLTLAADGTFLVAGLAWKPGDAAWTLREVPARAFVAGDQMLGIAGGELYASADTGATWQKKPAPPFTDADAVAHDGSWLVSTFAGDGDSWHAQLWQSSDASAWTSVYDGMSSRSSANAVLGDAHRFVGVSDRWIATDATSDNSGATWTSTDVNNDHSPAFLAPDGRLVATYPGQGFIRVFSDGGESLEATYAPSLSGDVQSLAIDADGYAYLAGGAPYVQIWRSVRPL